MGYSNPKCYARILGDCSKKLSGEHFMSRCVLKILGNYHRISNVGWFKPETKFKELSIESMKAKVLCKKHNELLSYLDDEAERFFNELINAFKDYNKYNLYHKTTINGDYLERWMLKIFFGALSSGYLLKNNRRILINDFSDELIKELYSKKMYNQFVKLGINKCKINPYRGYSYGLLYNKSGPNLISGAILEFMGVDFSITFDEQVLQLKNAKSGEITQLIPRPGRLLIESKYRKTDIEIFWSNWIPNNVVSFSVNVPKVSHVEKMEV